jgi:hypothetical protein
VIIDDHQANSMAIFNSTPIPQEGTTFIFGSWVCVANGQGGFSSYLTNPRELEAPSPVSSHDVGILANGLSEIQLSNPIGNHASHLRAVPIFRSTLTI